LNGAEEFNGIQRLGSTQLDTIQHWSSVQTESPGTVTARMTGRERLKVENMHDTYPASDGEPGSLEKICGVKQTPPVKTPQCCAGEVMHRRPNET
jgi:hypothetical protein